MSARAPSRCRSSGFTLVELMVVMVLIGIMTAILLPEMKGTLEAEALQGTSRRVIEAVHLAYSRAVTLNQPHRVVLDAAAHRYRVEGRVAVEGGGTAFRLVQGSPGAEGAIDARVTVAFRRPGEGSVGLVDADPAFGPDEGDPTTRMDGPLLFYPDGTADGADVILEDRQGFRLALRLDATTARIRVEELPRQ